MVSGAAPPMRTDDVCWICLDDHHDNQGLFAPCKCPRKVHPKCLARWQLQQAGRPEETHCRFCNSPLADWKASLTPESLKPEVPKVQPIMVVYFEGEIHRIPVKQGSDGLKEFTGRIRELFRLPEDVDISLTFGCKEPLSGQHLKLEGIGAFDAAVHCASVAAAERQAKIRSQSAGNLGAAQRTTSAQGPAPEGAEDNRAGSPASPTTPNLVRQHAQSFNHRRARSFYTPRTERPASTSSLPTPPTTHSLLQSTGTTTTLPPSPSMVAGSRSLFASLGRNRRQREGGDEANFSDSCSSPTNSCDPAEFRENEGELGEAGRNAPRRSRHVPSKYGEASVDLPAMDETVALGSLTGRLKFTLKAFSRKVARSFSFNRSVNISSPRSQSMSRTQSNSESVAGISSEP